MLGPDDRQDTICLCDSPTSEDGSETRPQFFPGQLQTFPRPFMLIDVPGDSSVYLKAMPEESGRMAKRRRHSPTRASINATGLLIRMRSTSSITAPLRSDSDNDGAVGYYVYEVLPPRTTAGSRVTGR
jgi:hypothetical protein